MTTKSSKKPGKSTKSAAKKRTTKSGRKASELRASAAPDSFRKNEVGRNGLRSFAFHRRTKARPRCWAIFVLKRDARDRARGPVPQLRGRYHRDGC